MIDVDLQTQILAELDRLSAPSQRQVLEFARSLGSSRTPKGKPGRELMHFFGVLSHEEAEQMKRDIEESCERIDADEW